MLSRVGAYRGKGFYEHATLGSDDNNFGGISIEFSEGASITA